MIKRLGSWFRLYDDVVDEPKVQRLAPDVFRAWINLLCVASKNGGVLPQISDISYRLRIDETEVKRFIETLCETQLFDTKNGEISPHNWEARQFTSDNSTARVRKFREKHQSHKGGKKKRNVSCNVSRNVSETANETFITEQNRVYISPPPPLKNGGIDDSDKTVIFSEFDALRSAYPRGGGRRKASGPSNEFAGEFESWYSAYPRREGRGQAFKAYRAARKKVSAEILLNAVKRDALRFEGKERQFIPHPATWLNGERWTDDPQQQNSKPIDWRSVL